MSYADVVLADSPSAYWRLGEPSGTNAVDEAVGNDGTYTNTPTLAATGALGGSGDADTAVTFTSASSEYVTVPDSADVDLGDGPFTIEFWIKLSTTGTIEHILGKGTTGGDAYNVLIATDGTLWLKNMNGGSPVIQTVATISETTNWHHVVFTKDGATRAAYLDGAASTSLGTDVALADSTAALIIGAYAAGGPYADVSLDEVALYKSVLSAAAVLAHYEAGTESAGGGGGDIAQVQKKNGTLVTTGAYALTFDAAPTSGNLMIGVWCLGTGGSNPGTVTVPTDWTKRVEQQRTTGQKIVIAEKVAGASESATVTLGSNNVGVIGSIFEYSGMDASPFDVAAPVDGGASGITSLAVGPTAATAVANSLAIAGWGLANTSGGSESVSGYTIEDTSSDKVIVATKVLSATGAQSATAVWATSRTTVAGIVVYKGGAAVAAPVGRPPLVTRQAAQRAASW